MPATGSEPVAVLGEAWTAVLRHDYEPVFRPALNVLEALAAADALGGVNQAVWAVAAWAKENAEILRVDGHGVRRRAVQPRAREPGVRVRAARPLELGAFCWFVIPRLAQLKLSLTSSAISAGPFLSLSPFSEQRPKSLYGFVIAFRSFFLLTCRHIAGRAIADRGSLDHLGRPGDRCCPGPRHLSLLR